MNKTTLVILAAGFGSRFGGAKQIESVDREGNALIDYSIYDAIEAGFSEIVFIVREEIRPEFENRFRPKLEQRGIGTKFVVQDVFDIPARFLPTDRTKPWGTGQALNAARKVVEQNFCVINADDFYGRSSFVQMQQFLKETRSNDFAMVGFPIEKTLSPHGTVSRGICEVDNHGFLRSVEERTKIYRKSGKLFFQETESSFDLPTETVVSMNMWGFTPGIFESLKECLEVFLLGNAKNQNSEFYLPEVVGHLLSTNHATVRVFVSESEWMGLTYREDLELVAERLAELRSRGFYPSHLF